MPEKKNPEEKPSFSIIALKARIHRVLRVLFLVLGLGLEPRTSAM